MAGELADLRAKIKSIADGAWSVEGAIEFRKKLEGIFPKDLKDRFRDCIETSPTPRDCLRSVAEEAGLREEFEKAWKEAPADLIEKLRAIRGAWGPDTRSKVMEVVEKLDIPELYSLCMAGDFGAVKEKAGLSAEPRNFAECARMVARMKDLRKELRALWS